MFVSIAAYLNSGHTFIITVSVCNFPLILRYSVEDYE